MSIAETFEQVEYSISKFSVSKSMKLINSFLEYYNQVNTKNKQKKIIFSRIFGIVILWYQKRKKLILQNFSTGNYLPRRTERSFLVFFLFF